MNNSTLNIIISLLSSTVLLAVIQKISDFFNSRNSKVIQFEQVKLELLFEKIDFNLRNYLFFHPQSNKIPSELKETLLKFQKIIEDNPTLGLSLGTRLKESLMNIIERESFTDQKELKLYIQTFSTYYCFELKKCKKILKFPNYSIVYPRMFSNKIGGLMYKISDLTENFAIVYLIFSTFLGFFALLSLIPGLNLFK